MDIKKELEETKNKLQNLAQEIQMLEQAKNEKTVIALKLQGRIETLQEILKEEK